jgi:hypothetical protein
MLLAKSQAEKGRGDAQVSRSTAPLMVCFCTRTCLRSSSPASYLFKTLSAHFRKISSTDTPLRADDSRKMSSLLCARLLPSRNVTSRLSCKSLLLPATCGIQVQVTV